MAGSSRAAPETASATRRSAASRPAAAAPSPAAAPPSSSGTRSAIFVNNSENLIDVKTSKTEFQSLLKSAGFQEITTEIKKNIEFYFAEIYHQQYLHKNPNGYCGLGGSGVKFK